MSISPLETKDVQNNGIDNFNPNALSENAKVILEKRYLLRDEDGNVKETPQEMFRRVADAVAKADIAYGADDDGVASTANTFYKMMSSLKFLPNSPTLMNAGTEMGTLSACFVLPLSDTMEGITKASHDQAMVQKFGGGTGFALSEIRPKNTPISTTHGKACGPVEALRYLSATSKLVTQGGKRDGANMAVLNVHHPDILEFISCKTIEGDIHNFNISVGATDEFMKAVESDTDYALYFREDPSDQDSKMVEVGRLNAREVFDKIIEGAWKNGEPGMIFLDEVNRNSPVRHIGEITATNPCGEQPLLSYEPCNLGSINVADMEISHNEDYEIVDTNYELGYHVVNSVHFLDNIIDINQHPIEEIEEMSLKTRKIGLGVMGFADLLYKMDIPYDSEEGVAIGRSLMRYIKNVADKASETLASKRGAYPAWKNSEHKYRNACRLTVAPTGTISMIADCSSGIEPIFSLAYRKHNILGGDTTLYYANPIFEERAKQDEFYSEELIDALANGESLQTRDDVPEDVKTIFKVSADIAPNDHVDMQAAFQESVDSGISKTINFPNEATKDDVENAYMRAWENKCKGITVYRAGSRDKEVLTKGTKKTIKAGEIKESIIVNGTFTPTVSTPRPEVLESKTTRIETGRGKLYVTVAYDENGQPFELFTNHGKAGGNDSAMAEALSRMISLNLRSGVEPARIISQLINIQDNPIISGGKKILSVPDAIAQVLRDSIDGEVKDDVITEPCPECQANMVTEEGCMKCYECGFSKC